MEALKPKFIRSARSDDIWHLALPLGSVSGASNSQQAMWESSHQQVSVKSAAGSRPRCLQLFPLSPSLLRPSPYWQSVNLHVFWTEVWVAPLSRGPYSFEMRRWADKEPADPDLLFEVGGPRTLINLRGPSVGFMLLHNVLQRPEGEKCSLKKKPEWGAVLCMHTCLSSCCWMFIPGHSLFGKHMLTCEMLVEFYQFPPLSCNLYLNFVLFIPLRLLCVPLHPSPDLLVLTVFVTWRNFLYGLRKSKVMWAMLKLKKKKKEKNPPGS